MDNNWLQEQFRLMAETAPSLVRLSGPDKFCDYVNPAWQQFTGRTPADESGLGWLAGVHPDDLKIMTELIHGPGPIQNGYRIEYRIRCFDGTYRWLSDNGLPRFDENGLLSGFINCCVELGGTLEPGWLQKDHKESQTEHLNQLLNEELAATNEELSAANEELTSVNEELNKAQDSLSLMNLELEEKVRSRTVALQHSQDEAQALNEKLSETNEELAAINEELVSSNEELIKNEAELQAAFNELSLAKQQIEKTEKLFRTIASNIPGSLIAVVDRDQKIISIKGDLMERLGLEKDKDYSGLLFAEVASLEDYSNLRDHCDKALKGFNFSIERTSKNGNSYILHFVPLREEDEKVYACMVITLDITQIREAEKNSAMLAAIIESSNDIIVSKTQEGIITSWNKAAEEILGYEASEMIGQPIFKIVPEDKQEEELDILSRLRKGEHVQHFETKRLTKENGLIDLSLTISPVKDKSGGIIGFSKIARDISEKKKDEQRKSDFIAMVSHELKTPLTSLNLMVQVLEGYLAEHPSPYVLETLVKAGQQVKKMNSLINGFLNVSRLESSKILIIKKEFDIVRLIDEAIADMPGSGRSRLRFENEGSVLVSADPDKISSVISNLITNALKYSPDDSEVEVHCSSDASGVTVSVKDGGIGIKAQDIEKIFDRYYRVEGNFSRFVSGFGIGLYLSAEIIRLHHGKIWAESEFGNGSTFSFTLPLT